MSVNKWCFVACLFVQQYINAFSFGNILLSYQARPSIVSFSATGGSCVAQNRRIRQKPPLKNTNNDEIATTNDNDKFRMVFTCKSCKTRNMVEITRNAWMNGVVIATCQGCNSKHLLADNRNRLGSTDSKQFTNVLNNLNENATFIDSMDYNDDMAAKREALSEFDLTTDETGTIQLMPRPGDEIIVTKERASATGPTVDPSLMIDDVSVQSEMADIADNEGGAARMDSYENGGSFDIDLPAESEAGDLLQLSLGGNNGMMMLSVPIGLPSGENKVRVMGAIEFMVPEGRKEGDIITLKTPNGQEVIIQVPQGVTEGSFLKVAHPVILVE